MKGKKPNPTQQKAQALLQDRGEAAFKDTSFWVPPVLTLIAILAWIFWAGKQYFTHPSHQPQFTASITGIFETPFFGIFATPFEVWFSHLGSLVWIVLFLFTCFHAGDLILEKLRVKRQEALTHACLSTGLGMVALSMIVFLLAAVRLLYAPVVVALQAGMTVMAILRHKKVYSIWTPDWKPSNWYKHTNLSEKLAASVVLIYVATIAAVAFLPEIFYDSLVYHLALPSLWLIKHSFVHLPYLAFSTMPSLIQINYCWGFSAANFAGFLHGDVLAKLLHFSMGLLTVMAIYGYAKPRWGRMTGLLAAVFFYSVPVITMNSWTSGNDVGTGLFQTLAILSLFIWHESLERENENPGEPRTWWILTAVFLGAAMSSKYTGIFGVTATFLVASAVVIRRNADRKSGILQAFWFGLVIVLVWSPWLIKNLIFTGNPLHPFLYRIFGAQNLSLQAASSITGTNPGAEFNLVHVFKLDFFVKFVTSFWRIAMSGNDSVRYAGPVLLLFGPLVFFIRRWPFPIKVSLFVFALSYFFWFTGHEFARYLSPVYGTMALTIAFAWTNLQSRFPAPARFAILLIPLGVALAVWSPLSLIVRFTYTPWTALTGKISRDEFLGRSRGTYPNPSYKMYRYINENLPLEGSRILLVGDNKAYGLEREFAYYTVEYNVPILQTWIGESENETELFQKMKEEGLTHLAINYREFIRLHPKRWDEKSRDIFDKFWSRYVVETPYFAEGTYLYEIRSDLPNDHQPPLNILLELNNRAWQRQALMQIFVDHNLWSNAIDEVESWARFGSPIEVFLANLYQKRNEPGDLERAIRAYSAALQRESQNTKLSKQIALLYHQTGNHGAALDAVYRGLSVNPNDRDLKNMLQTLTQPQVQ